MNSMVITRFIGHNFFLSNFFLSPICYQGKVYDSVEHAYQAAKTDDDSLRIPFHTREKFTASEAKRAGRLLPLREDWENIKIEVMRELVFTKFEDAQLRQKLIDTSPCLLIEGNTWGDKFWGVCNNEGHNWLGRILMDKRAIINTERFYSEW